ARRHLEQVTSAVLEASTARASRADPARRFRELASAMDRPSRAAYRALVDAPGFEEWSLRVSPIEELSGLRIAPRPARGSVGRGPDLSTMVLREYDLTMEWVLVVTGHRRLLEDRRVLSWAIELRNPYVDALSHLQLRALRGIRDPRTSKGDRALAERVFQLSVNGVAAGLRETG